MSITRRRVIGRLALLAGAAFCLSSGAAAQHLKIFQEGAGLKGAGAAGLDWLERIGTEALKKQGNLEEIGKGFAPLSPDDTQIDPEYPPPPQGGLPARCAGLERSVCKQCGFDTALIELGRTRYRLEKLGRVGASTKNLVSNSMAAGDSMAGAAGVGGLQWVSERNNILRSYQQFQQSYDAKYIELMGLLQGSLRQIAKCEALVFGEENWYERFGFMYYEFMAARYRRPD